MGGYDSKKFSKEFSERTRSNLDYITRTVNRDEMLQQNKIEFLNQCEEILKQLDSVKKQIREEAKTIPVHKKTGGSELKRHLFTVARQLETQQEELKRKNELLLTEGDIPGQKLYEITQLINSLMGIAVLPYEMHKEFFDKNAAGTTENLKANQQTLKETYGYNYLKEKILELHRQGKWKTTFEDDIWPLSKELREDRIVFRFLKHIRNTVCHSGDNAISILPLDDGVVINEVIFYDQNYKNKQQEFAMRLCIDDLRELVSRIEMFYCKTGIGELDKTKKLQNVELSVNKILGDRKSTCRSVR